MDEREQTTAGGLPEQGALPAGAAARDIPAPPAVGDPIAGHGMVADPAPAGGSRDDAASSGLGAAPEDEGQVVAAPAPAEGEEPVGAPATGSAALPAPVVLPPIPLSPDVEGEEEPAAPDTTGVPPTGAPVLGRLEQRNLAPRAEEEPAAVVPPAAPRITDELPPPAEVRLARGSVVGDRYTIVSEPQAVDGAEETRYLAIDALAYQQCWSCGSRENGAGMRFCQSCGAGLQDHPVVLAWTPAPAAQPGEFPGPTGYLHVVPQRRRFGAEGIGVQIGAYSAEGPHHPNEDSYWHVVSTTCGNSRRESLGVFIFADGMGGYQPGSGLISKRAAATVGEALWASLAPYRLPDADLPDDGRVEELVRQALAAGNAAVLAEIARQGFEMGCTIIATVLLGETAYVANVGDSRAYYLSPTGDAAQITEDQSHVGALVAAGHLAPEAVYTAAGNNVILHAMGEEGVEQAAGWWVQPLEPTGVLLLCSDGYWKTVHGAGRAVEVINDAPSLDEAARALVNDALDRGSDDNTTVVIARVL